MRGQVQSGRPRVSTILALTAIQACVSLANMAAGHWTNIENDRIVADYFAMLKADLAGQPYNKAEHNQRLRSKIDRGRGSIEYKHQNISAVLQGLGEPWIPGYKPALRFQMSLIYAVRRWLHWNLDFQPVSITNAASDLNKPANLIVGHAPTLRHRPPPDKLEQRLLSIECECDAAGRAERNRALGRAGEEHVLADERAKLTGVGRTDLAKSVRWVSEEDGDGAGYDIASFYPEGRPRLIEVKTTNGWERTPFHITRNELAVSKDRPHEWCLLRLWDFARQPKAFELRPPLNAHVTLITTSYEARFH